MTRDDAIKIFNTVLCLGKCDCSKDEIEECLKMAVEALQQQIYGQPKAEDAGGKEMNEFTKIRDRILARIETYIADIEFAEEQELTEDEKTIFKSVKDIILEEFDKASSDTEHIIKDTIKEYIDKDCDDVVELLLNLSKDLCERIRKED